MSLITVSTKTYIKQSRELTRLRNAYKSANDHIRVLEDNLRRMESICAYQQEEIEELNSKYLASIKLLDN